MNAPNGPKLTLDEKVTALMATVDQLVSQRNETEALRVFREAEALAPDHQLVLHEKARRLFVAGDVPAGLALFEHIVRLAPKHLPFRLSLAAVLRRLERREEELATLESALSIDPTHLVVLLQKGALLDLMDRPRTAAATYAHALQTLSPRTRLPPALEAHVSHARKRVAENAAVLAKELEARLQPLIAAGGTSEARMRFDRCMDRMLGVRRVYVPEPTYMLFPYLNNYEFLPRDQCPWLETLESQTEIIRHELLGVLASDEAQIQPYVAYPEGVPLDQWSELNHSRRWGAYFLWNEGRQLESHGARCPQTVATLEGLPQVDIPGRGPTAFFSILEPHTRIPPHTGVTNTRLTVHLPLIVPPECRFRVGGDTREVRAGHAWVFDDTIEHEAWNDSAAPRAILIFDIWNPQLTALERDLVREATLALKEYSETETQ